MEKRFEVALAVLLTRCLELLAHQVVVDRLLDGAKDAERHGAVRLPGDARQGEGEARLAVVRVVDEQRALPRLGDVDDASRPVRVLDEAALTVGTESNRLSTLEVDPLRLVLANLECAVVVDVAVLEDLDERRTAMPRRGARARP